MIKKRKPRILWANVCCLLDTSSGASLSVREMLRQLDAHGYEVAILGATVFDAQMGVSQVKHALETVRKNRKRMIEIQDGSLTHRLITTASVFRKDMTSLEEGSWYGQYIQMLDTFRPDLVWFYGGQPFDFLIPDEARYRNIPTAALLVNGNYQGRRWFRDVDIILTDSKATAEMYRRTQGYHVYPVGKFVNPENVVSSEHTRQRLLFINPTLEKGAGIVVQLAILLERQRPDIIFEVVQSRGDWHEHVKHITASLGEPRTGLQNVIVTPSTKDMRSVYGRARIVLSLSLWWESGSRVLAEAMLNGIPAIITDRGGPPEMIGNAGLKLRLPERFHEKPYKRLPKPELLTPLVHKIIELYDDESLYQEFVARARYVGATVHDLSISTRRLMQALEPCIDKRAGDRLINEPDTRGMAFSE